VLALIAGYEVMQPLLARLRGTGGGLRWSAHHLVALALTSLLAGTASAPFAAYHFGHFQLYFILANLVAVPLTAMWVMPAGLAALMLMPFRLEWIALTPMGWGIDIILWIARHVAALPAATIGVPHFPAWGVGVHRARSRLAGALAHFSAPSGPGAGRSWVDGRADQPSCRSPGVP